MKENIIVMEKVTQVSERENISKSLSSFKTVRRNSTGKKACVAYSTKSGSICIVDSNGKEEKVGIVPEKVIVKNKKIKLKK